VLDYLNREITDSLVDVKGLDLSEKDTKLVGSMFHILRVVADTFEVCQHIQINHAVLRGTLVVLQAIQTTARTLWNRRS